MKHLGTKVLETERLILRPFTMEDSERMFYNWATSEKVTKFLTWQPHQSQDVTKEILAYWLENYKNLNFYQWAIELKEIKEPIGSISVVRIDDQNKECEIGYCIGDKWWGKGITCEALKSVMNLLFEEVGAKVVCAKHDVDNPNSGKVMVKAGMTFRRILDFKGKSNHGICDLAFYSKIKE